MNFIVSILDWKPLTILVVIASFLLAIYSGSFKDLRGKIKFLFAAGEIYALLVTTISLIFSAVLLVDQLILSSIHAFNHPLGSGIHVVGSYLSMNTRFWLLLTSALLICYLVGMKHWFGILFGAVFSAALAGLGSQTSKFITARARPYAGEGPFSFFNYDDIKQHAAQSLPSGDVAIVAGASAYFFYSIKNILLRMIVLAFPLCAAYYRIRENKHWPSDTIASIGIGFLAAFPVWKMSRYEPKRANFLNPSFAGH